MGFESLVNILINAKSDVGLSNKRGFTAPMLSKFNGYNFLKISDEVLGKLRFDNIILEEGKKYSSMDIIKKEIYCENKEAKRLVFKIFNNIEKYGDFRIELIMMCIALYTLEKNNTGNNLQIFVTNHFDTSVFSGKRLDGMYMIGSYNVLRNVIQISGFGGDFVATQTFLHELVHKIHLSFEDLKLNSLKGSVEKVLERLEEIPKSNGSRYIRNNLVKRIDNDSYYNDYSSKLLEYLADSISYIIIYKKYENDVLAKEMKYILKSIYDVFDYEISKVLKEYILKNKNFDKIKLSDSMKESLTEFKNHIIDTANRKHKLQQIPSNYCDEKGYTWDSFI